MSNFDKNVQLFHTDDDRAEDYKTWTEQYPEQGRELADVDGGSRGTNTSCRFKRHGGCRQDCRSSAGGWEFKVQFPLFGEVRLLPRHDRGAERSRANATRVSYKVLDEVELRRVPGGICASVALRWARDVLKRCARSTTPTYLGIPPATHVNAPSRAGKHFIGVEFTKERMGEPPESTALAALCDDKVVAEQEIRTMTDSLVCGEGLCLGTTAATR